MTDLDHNVIARIRDCAIFRDDDFDGVQFFFYETEAKATKELDRIRRDALHKAWDSIKLDKDTFEACGRKETIGFHRALMILEEMLLELGDRGV